MKGERERVKEILLTNTKDPTTVYGIISLLFYILFLVVMNPRIIKKAKFEHKGDDLSWAFVRPRRHWWSANNGNENAVEMKWR